MELANPGPLTFEIIQPEFAFLYFSTQGYALGGSTRLAKSGSFSVKLGSEAIAANLGDFGWISADTAFVKLRTPKGVASEGGLVL